MLKQDLIEQSLIKKIKKLEAERRSKVHLNDFDKHYYPLMKLLLLSKLRSIGPRMEFKKVVQDSKKELQLIRNFHPLEDIKMSETNVTSHVNSKYLKKHQMAHKSQSN